MKLFDRYKFSYIEEKDLPNRIDLGRFIYEKDNSKIEITNITIKTEKAICSQLLKEENKGIHEVLIEIGINVENDNLNNFKVIPLIQPPRHKLELNTFEKLLYDKVFHIESIIRDPHYLLKREIEKVNVSRAKRIPSKSYQYLASHTEDWVHKSIVNFKPSRILNEELELNFDIYENQLAVAFILKSLKYLNARLKEIRDIKKFLETYDDLLKSRDDRNGWYKKIERNYFLMGNAIKDITLLTKDKTHLNTNRDDYRVLSDTEETLSLLSKRLLILRGNDLFNLVNKGAIMSVTLHDTNVIVNHKHYRYIKTLWNELLNIKPEKTESQKIKYEQDVIKGLRAYAKTLIAYTLKNNLDYDLKGNYSDFEATHLQLNEVNFQESDKGTLIIRIGDRYIKLVIVGNLPEFDEKFISLLEDRQTFILYYDETPQINNTRLVPINPLDPDSVERIGALIRKYLLIGYLDNIQRDYKYKQLLKEYIKYIPEQFIRFNTTSYTYKFHSYPKEKLSLEEIKAKIENDSLYKSKGRPDKENVIRCITELLNEIELITTRLKDEYLNCMICGAKLNFRQTIELNYLKCSANNCNCLIDNSNPNKLILKVDDDKHRNLTQKEFGMDSLTFNKAEF